VVLTPICQVVIERRAPKLGNVVGVFIVTIGLFFLTSPEGSKLNRGDLLTLGCALCFALYIVYLDIFTQDHHPAQLTFAQFFTTGIAGVLGASLFEELTWNPVPHLLTALAYLTVFATVIALYVQTKYQKDTTPTRAGIIFAVEPVFAAVFAYFVLGEVLGTLGIFGGGLIVAGLLVSELSDLFFKRQKSDFSSE
ncbi:MAG: DMT family transporter, partial [Bacteroidota bacterium]